MFALTIRLQSTPYGWRVTGPDSNRTIYLGNGQPNEKAEPIWTGNELSIWATPITDGVELTVNNDHHRHTSAQQAKAA